MRTYPIVGLIALFLHACATPITAPPAPTSGEIERERAAQMQLALEKEAAARERFNVNSQRLFDVSFPILRANAEFCAETRLFIGIAYVDTGIVSAIVPDSPAEQSGIAVGDRLISLNGKSIWRDNLSKLIAKYDGNPLKLETDKGIIDITPNRAVRRPGPHRGQQ